MAFTPIVLPDAELAVIQYLRSRSELTALVPSARITTARPNTPTYPLVLVQRIGGTSLSWNAIDEAALQVDVVAGADDKYLASRISRTVAACILAIANDTVSEGVLVSAVEEVGPQWIPDTVVVPPLARYVARFRVFLHK
jgi:hypothetical protein